MGILHDVDDDDMNTDEGRSISPLSNMSLTSNGDDDAKSQGSSYVSLLSKVFVQLCSQISSGGFELFMG